MSGARLKAKLAKGEPVHGLFFQYMTNPGIVEMFPEPGPDFVIVNAEHNAIDMGDFHGMQFALQSRGIACLVRIHNRDAEEVAKACDSYIDGVVIPYVEDPDQLRRLVGAAKYRPLKGPALDRVLTRGEWPSEKTKAYVTEKCANTFFAAMIESVHALDNLDALCSVPGLDAVFMGPNDLSVSMGIPEERDNPLFIGAMQRIIDVAKKHGVAAGAHFSKMSHAQRMIRQGATFVPFSSDARFNQHGLIDSLSALRGTKAEGKEKII